MRLSFLPAPLVCGVARGFFVCLDIFGVCLQGWFHPKKLFLLLDVFCLRRPSTLRCFFSLRVEHLLNFWVSPSGVFHPRMLFLLLDVFCLRRPSTLRSFSRFRVEPPPKFKAPAPGRVPPQDAFLALGCILPQAPFRPKMLFPL